MILRKIEGVREGEEGREKRNRDLNNFWIESDLWIRKIWETFGPGTTPKKSWTDSVETWRNFKIHSHFLVRVREEEHHNVCMTLRLEEIRDILSFRKIIWKKRRGGEGETGNFQNPLTPWHFEKSRASTYTQILVISSLKLYVGLETQKNS